MKVITAIGEFRNEKRKLRNTLGFVPTMGYLHQGHMNLVQTSKKNNSHTAVSIFVNPTQFSPSEDFSSYPRDLKRDLEMLEKEGVDLVFTPLDKEIYPPDFQTYVTVEEISKPLEGSLRHGHFRGVATVVCKLLNIVEPDVAYFGQKDAQQVMVIQQMVKDLNMNVIINVVETAREADGLAISSRNVYLNAEERKAAPILWDALTSCKNLYQAGERDANILREQVVKTITSEPLAKIDYVSIADKQTLAELDKVVGRALVSLAVRFGRTRLIDNLILD